MIQTLRLRYGLKWPGSSPISAMPWATIRSGIQIIGVLLMAIAIHGAMLERDIAERELAAQQAITMKEKAEAALVACLNQEAIHIGEGKVVFCDPSKEIQL